MHSFSICYLWLFLYFINKKLSVNISIFSDVFTSAQKFGAVEVVVNTTAVVNEPNWRRAVDVNYVSFCHLSESISMGPWNVGASKTALRFKGASENVM